MKASTNNTHDMILDLIPQGRDNAVTTQYLATLLKTDRRHVRYMIEKARVSGEIIAGTNDGLFIPETEDELREYVSRAFSHIKGSIKTLNTAYKRLFGRNIHFGGDHND